MPRPLILIAVLLLSGLAWFLLRAAPGDLPASAARPGEAGTPAPAQPSALGGVPAAPERAARAAAPAAPRALVDHRAALERNGLRLVCAATGKGVPRFRLRLSAGTEQVELVTNLDGWIELPGWARSGRLRVRVRSRTWGFRTAQLSAGAGAEPADSIEVEVAGEAGLELDWVGPNFLLVDVPGASFHPGYAPYGDFGHREVLEDDLLLCIETPGTDGAGDLSPQPFELRGNYEQWIAHGTVERDGLRIATERVSVQREALSRLDVSLQHGDGSWFKSPASVVLVDLATGENWADEVQGERAVFRMRQPGLYQVFGSAQGRTFGPLEVELLPFEKQRVDLRSEAAALLRHSLDLELSASLDQPVSVTQLPAKVTLNYAQDSNGGWSANDEELLLTSRERQALRRSAPVHWVGSGREWTGRVHYPDVPVGRYMASLSNLIPDPELLRRALREADLEAGANWQEAIPASWLRELNDPIWIYRDTRVSREIHLAVPSLERVDLTWDADDPPQAFGAQEFQRVMETHKPLGSSQSAGHIRVLFAKLQSGSGRSGAGWTEMRSPFDEYVVTLRQVGDARAVEPGYAALAFEFEVGAPRPRLSRIRVLTEVR